MRLVLSIVAAVTISSPTMARDVENRYAQAPDSVKEWFKNLRSPNGVPCCDTADGHHTDFMITNESPSGYRIPNPKNPQGDWVDVPKEAVINNQGNPVGEALVWWVDQGLPTPYIRCFVPGGGV